jgi:hypothetical protein
MTTRHLYASLSTALRECRPPSTNRPAYAQWAYCVALVGAALAADNRAFDPERFGADCNLIKPENER